MLNCFIKLPFYVAQKIWYQIIFYLWLRSSLSWIHRREKIKSASVYFLFPLYCVALLTTQTKSFENWTFIFTFWNILFLWKYMVFRLLSGQLFLSFALCTLRRLLKKWNKPEDVSFEDGQMKWKEKHRKQLRKCFWAHSHG